MHEIDGSMMEGGGQLLRMALTYSAITGNPVNIVNIRGRRQSPGLKPQHYSTVKALGEMCNAELEGLRLGSKSLKFQPGRIRGGTYKVDIGTAGSISLMLQCLTPVAAFADGKVKLEIKGGTAVKWSPPMTFLTEVVWRAYNRMGFKGEIRTIREGFYPKGGGLVQATIAPVNHLKPLTLPEQGKTSKIKGTSICGRLPEHVAARQASSASKVLGDSGYETEINEEPLRGAGKPLSPGSQITLWAQGTPELFIGADSLGERGKPAEKVGSEAAHDILKQLRTGATVDYHTADHLILPCSISGGESTFKASKISLHTSTAMKLAEVIVGAEFRVEKSTGEPGTIKCKGVKLPIN